MNKKIYILLFTFLLLLMCKNTEAQSADEVFPLGTWATGEPINNSILYDSIAAAGFNWIVQSANQQTKPYLEDFKVITQNGNPNEWIYYYSNGKYKKWEAEKDKFFFYETGFKHPHDNWDTSKGYLYGQAEEYLGAECWATADSVTYPVDSVLWGPNYYQDKNYKMIYNELPINYTVRYRLALLNAPANPQDTICRIYVRYRAYERINGEIQDTVEEIFDSSYQRSSNELIHLGVILAKKFFWVIVMAPFIYLKFVLFFDWYVDLS